MMDLAQRQALVALLHEQVVPAVGCTEPAAVALATAKACEVLGCPPRSGSIGKDIRAALGCGCPDRLDVRLSPNMLKNALGVGIPGTGMVGLPIAIALGALIGQSTDGLQVLKDVTPEAVSTGRRLIQEGRIHIALAPEPVPLLYIEVTATRGQESATAVIADSHTRFVRILRNGQALSLVPAQEDNSTRTPGLPDPDTASTNGEEQRVQPQAALRLSVVYDFATTAPLEEIDFINEAAHLNLAAAETALQGNYGHQLGKTLTRPLGLGILGPSIYTHILATTAAACDARMAGALLPVMSNSGSGNQGICATNPVAVFARENHNTAEELTRALILSHLTAIYIKQSLGTLSALCGCVVASTGSACGITYLMGGDYPHICAAVKNMVANLTGMICDGAKPACALKLSSAVSTAVLSALLAMQGQEVSAAEGIIDEDVDRSIHNLTRIGHDAMRATDQCVLDIMCAKHTP